MTSVDYFEYFLVKERIVDISFQDNLEAAKNGAQIDQFISDLYLARKLIYQACKSVESHEELENLLIKLKSDVPNVPQVFNKNEFTNAWIMTIKELREKFKIEEKEES